MDALDPARRTALPDDDLARELTVVDRDDPQVRHVFLAGDSYSVLVPGSRTAGRYTLIDMTVPDGGGPPPHRHDFEEMFTVLEGEVTFSFRGQEHVASAGTTVNIPANAPHFFRNRSGSTARMLCLCTPAGQEEFFLVVGDELASLHDEPPRLTEEEQAERGRRAQRLAASYRTEMLT